MTAVATSVVIDKLMDRIVTRLDKGPATFNQIVSSLRIKPELVKRLDNTLQELRKAGEIHFASPTVGWKIGKGRKYFPNVR